MMPNRPSIRQNAEKQLFALSTKVVDRLLTMAVMRSILWGMVACELNGKKINLSGPAEDIVRWLANGGNSVFGAPNLQGSITFNFHTGNENTKARVTPVLSGIASPPGTAM